jgi:1-acyl-sn-glycerol-3-phosphate acyltransferase
MCDCDPLPTAPAQIFGTTERERGSDADSISSLRAAVWQHPLPSLASGVDRVLLRVACRLALSQVVSVRGDAAALTQHRALIVAANHSSRREAMYLPALLMLLRGGRPVHFLADWNFRLIPGMGWLYDRAGAITVARKSARPRFLNHFRRRWRQRPSALAQARSLLANGAQVAVFPEGTVNRSATRLLRGERGAARLSLSSGAPIVPVGIRFLGQRAGNVIDSSSAICVHVGQAIRPPAVDLSNRAVAAWHSEIMQAIGAVSGKAWQHGRSANLSALDRRS